MAEDAIPDNVISIKAVKKSKRDKIRELCRQRKSENMEVLIRFLVREIMGEDVEIVTEDSYKEKLLQDAKRIKERIDDQDQPEKIGGPPYYGNP